MSEVLAKQGDRIVGLDTHIVLVKEKGGEPVAMQFPFSGRITQDLSDSVFVDNKGAAVVGSRAVNLPGHVPIGGSFETPPSNKGTIAAGSSTVFIGSVGVGRAKDPACCCNDPVDADTGHVVAKGTVYAG